MDLVPPFAREHDKPRQQRGGEPEGMGPCRLSLARSRRHERDEDGGRGGTEFAFMSTTLDKSVALHYAGQGGAGVRASLPTSARQPPARPPPKI